MDKKNDYIQLPPMKKDTSADAVSYTHLDVYKRQQDGWCSPSHIGTHLP